MKYVKKPVVVEAFQFGVDQYPEWMPEDLIFFEGSNRLLIPTIEGPMYANMGDMIIKEIKEENYFYGCKKDIFDASYDVYDENVVLGKDA